MDEHHAGRQKGMKISTAAIKQTPCRWANKVGTLLIPPSKSLVFRTKFFLLNVPAKLTDRTKHWETNALVSQFFVRLRRLSTPRGQMVQGSHHVHMPGIRQAEGKDGQCA